MKTISFNRLKYLFIEYFTLHWKRDLMIMGGVLLAQIPFIYLQMPIFEFGLFLIGVMPIILCSITFNFWHKKTKGMDYLLCPANTAEKVIVNILLVHIYYTAIILLSCALGVFTYYLLYPQCEYAIIPSSILTKIYNFSYILQFFVKLFASQSIFLFASIYFKKNALLKTILIFLVSSFIFLAIFKITGISSMMTVVDEHHFKSMTLNGVHYANLLDYILHKYAWLYYGVLVFIAPVFFWLLSYFRLKETEV